MEKDQHLTTYKKKKPQLAEDLKEWYYTLQPSVKTNNFESRYYAEISFKHAALTLGQKIPKITVPIQVYYQSKNSTQNVNNISPNKTLE